MTTHEHHHEHHIVAGFEETLSMTVKLVGGAGARSFELSWEPVTGDPEVSVVEDMTGEPHDDRRVTWTAIAEFTDGRTVTGVCEPSDRSHDVSSQLACVALLTNLGANVAVLDVDGG